MKVSAIMPLFNKAAFVQEAIESLLAEQFDGMEVIVVDDASTDDSYERVAAMENTKVRLFRNEINLGAAMCAQRCIDQAQGQYLLRLDADDRCVPGRIEKQVALMDQHPELGVCGGFLRLFGDSDDTWEFPETDAACKAHMLFGIPVSQGTAMMRSSVIKEHSIRYTEEMPAVGEDREYWLQWERVSAFHNIQEPMTLYRRGEHNSTHGRDAIADNLAMFRSLFKHFGLPEELANVRIHLLTKPLFSENPTPRLLAHFKKHLEQLNLWNSQEESFDPVFFQNELDGSWQRLFFHLVPYGKNLVEAFSELSGGLSPEQKKYWKRSRLNKLLGRK